MSKSDQLKSQRKSISGRRRKNYINLRHKRCACLRARDEWGQWDWSGVVVRESSAKGCRTRQRRRTLVATIWIKTKSSGKPLKDEIRDCVM